MECSILAIGRSKVGTVDGKKTNVVDELREALSVDWVTKAGAGGQAIALSETDEPVEGDEIEVIDEVSGNIETPNVEENQEDGLEEDERPEAPETEGTETTEAGDPDDEPTGESDEADQELDEPETVAETEPEDEGLTILSEGQVIELLKLRPGLPSATRDRLLSREYQTEEEVAEAIQAEVDYLKLVTKSGKPFGDNSIKVTEKQPMTSEEFEDRLTEIVSK